MKVQAKKVSALTFPKYAKFVDARDRAAEKMLANFRLEQTDILRKYFRDVLNFVSRFVLHSSKDLKGADAALEQILKPLVGELHDASQDLRYKAFMLSLVGEAEAIGRITGKATYDASRAVVRKHLDTESMAGGSTRDRVALFVDRLRRDVVDALQISLLKKDKPIDTFHRVIGVLPKIKRQPKTIRVLSKIREAKYPQFDLDKLSAGDIPSREDISPDPNVPAEIATGTVNDQDWQSVVDSYTDEYKPLYSDRDYILPGEPNIPDDEKVYASDVERDATEDFVKSVRDGQVEAANQNGIDDFMWIAVLDEKTCEDCCAPRDGMSSKEIEAALNSGALDGDCDEIVPPAHPNCRCRLAPMVETSEQPVEVDTNSFDDWANS